MPSPRLLVIGLDAADESWIREFISDGDLPVISHLLETAAAGPTVSPPGLFVGAVWPTIYTGVSPASHGRYCFRQLDPGTYQTRRITTSDVAVEPFWGGLSRAGRKVAVVDVPKAPLTPDIKGLQVVDWGTHDPDHPGVRTWPEDLAAQLTARHGTDSVGNCNAFRHSVAEFREFERQLVDRVTRKTDLASELLALKPWDLFMVGFSEAHCVGHQCWHLRDKEHPRYDEALAAGAGDIFRNVYRALDSAVGRLLDQAGPGTPSIVFGSHGFAPHYDASFLLERILLALESPRVAASAGRASLVRGLWKRLPQWMRAPAARFSGQARDRLALHPLASRRAFQIPNNDAWGAIRINLVGREPNGRVQPGRDFEYACDRLTTQLSSIANCATGRPVIRQVIRRNRIYKGPQEDALPDLMVEWSRDAAVSAVYSEATGIIEGAYGKCRTGDHRPEGWYAMSGLGMAPGWREASADVLDYAPTIADFLDVNLPHLQGKSLLDERVLAA